MRQALFTLRRQAGLIHGSLAGLSLIVAVAGCAGRAGFDREAMRAVIHPDPGIASEQPINVTPAATPALTVPFKLALYFVRQEVPHRQGLQNPEWVSADKDALAHRLTPLRDERIVTDLFLLADPTIQGHDPRKIRQAAARYGMDAVLILDGIGAVDRFNNGYAALYPTLVGAYLAPGTESEALVMIEGTLWDARSELLYTAQTAEGGWKAVGPAMAIEDRDVLAKAKHAALEEFGNRIIERLRLLRDERTRSSDRSR